MKFWFLEHSGVAVKTAEHMLLFDVFGDILHWEDGRGLGDGVVNPMQLLQENVVLFVSHEHPDHFDMKIFELKDTLQQVQYILPEELDEVVKDAVFVHNNMTVETDGCKITTFESTDIGVGYLVEVDGKLIYHAGDLNWWHWEGEDEEFNLDQARRYQQQMQLLAQAVGERELDVAFVPVDPRLGEDMLRGVCCLLENVRVKSIVPIHFWGDFGICDCLIHAPEAAGFASRTVRLSARGDEFDF